MIFVLAKPIRSNTANASVNGVNRATAIYP